MYRDTYEHVDMDKWRMYREAGLAIAETPTFIPLEEREAEVLGAVAEYVHEYQPVFEVELGLKRSAQEGQI